MTLKPQDLNQFTGTEVWYRYPLLSGYLYTEGVQHVAQEGQAYWLINDIFDHQRNITVSRHPFQVWNLTVNDDDSAILMVDDGDYNKITRQQIPYTNFPLRSIKFYLADKVLMLPSEY